MASGTYSGDWSSGGHAVAPDAVSWGYGKSYPVYYNSNVLDPWYRHVAWPFLNDWHLPPSYYPNYYYSNLYNPYYYGVEMRPGEARAEWLFNYGIGEPWVGGDPPYSHWSH
jgi:hypothetical protein